MEISIHQCVVAFNRKSRYIYICISQQLNFLLLYHLLYNEQIGQIKFYIQKNYAIKRYKSRYEVLPYVFCSKYRQIGIDQEQAMTESKHWDIMIVTTRSNCINHTDLHVCMTKTQLVEKKKKNPNKLHVCPNKRTNPEGRGSIPLVLTLHSHTVEIPRYEILIKPVVLYCRPDTIWSPFINQYMQLDVHFL